MKSSLLWEKVETEGLSGQKKFWFKWTYLKATSYVEQTEQHVVKKLTLVT